MSFRKYTASSIKAAKDPEALNKLEETIKKAGDTGAFHQTERLNRNIAAHLLRLIQERRIWPYFQELLTKFPKQRYRKVKPKDTKDSGK